MAGPTITRRLALAGLGAALVPACKREWSSPDADPTSRSQIKPYVKGVEDYATFEERWFTSSCAQCTAACGIRVRVVEGRAVRIEGDPANPLNRGGIGARGMAGLQALYDPDRITGPLRRVGDRLVSVSWEDALATLGKALAEVRASTPEQLLVISGLERGFTHELLARFCRAFGTPNFVDGSAAHGGVLAHAMEDALGVHAAPAFGWSHANAIFSLEAALLEDSCRSIYFTRLAAAMRRDRPHRARLIHAGPAFDLAAYNADRWLRIAPGTSGALALGVCNVLLREGIYDRERIDPARGLTAFRALVAAFTPEHTAKLTGVPADAIVELAHELWDRRPVLAIADERSLAFSNASETAAAAIALSGLLGAIENGAGGMRIAPEPPFAAWPEVALDESAAPRLEMTPAAIAAAPPKIALLYHANPAYARAQPQRWREALAAIPLVVSFSPYLDETVAGVADLVLPDHTYLERFEDAPPAPGLPRAVAGIRKPVVAPLHNTRATADVIIQLANRLGDPIAGAFGWRNAREAFEQRWLGLHAAARGTIVEPSPRAFLDRLYEVGFWAEVDDAPPRAIDLALPPTWSAPQWDGDPAQFPLALLPYKPLGYAEGSGANQPWLHSLRGRPGLSDWTLAASIAPGDAPHGVADGDRARVISPYGALVLPVHLDPRLAPGCVAIPMGGGHTSFGRSARGFGVNVMELVSPTRAPLSCTTRVRVEAV